jgi:glycosyltransferase involved in cell wall biosynthesis
VRKKADPRQNRDTVQRAEITAVILTMDEEVNIVRCLECLAWVDDVVIVDSGSTDRTLEMAGQARPDVRTCIHPFQDFADQRNWALDHAAPRHDWVLFVDADEFCTEELADEIRSLLRDPGQIVGAYIAGRNYFLGRWVKHASLYPSYQLRLLKRGHVRFRKEGHGQREEADGPCAYLRQNWRHEWMSKGLDEWMRRHRRYAEKEVDALLSLRQQPLVLGEIVSSDPILRRRAGKRCLARMGRLAPIGRFFYRYVVRSGWRDGRPGWMLCVRYFVHDMQIQSALRARSRANAG